MSKGRERRQNFPAQAEAIVDAKISEYLFNDNVDMASVNKSPRNYKLEEKAEIAQHLNWDMKMALRKNEITGDFIVGKSEGQDDEDAGIYLKPYDN